MTISMIDVINAGAKPQVQTNKGCPFCGAEPGLARQIGSRYFVACENDGKHDAQAYGLTVEEAWESWNNRK